MISDMFDMPGLHILRLLQVVDMPAVLEAISILEKYPVTKEVLEVSDEGRFITS